MAQIQPQEEPEAVCGRVSNIKAPPSALMSLEEFNAMEPVFTEVVHRIEEDDGRQQRQFSMYMNKKRFALPEGGLIPLGKRSVTQHEAPGLCVDGKMGIRAAPLRLRGLRFAAMLKMPTFLMCSMKRDANILSDTDSSALSISAALYRSCLVHVKCRLVHTGTSPQSCVTQGRQASGSSSSWLLS